MPRIVKRGREIQYDRVEGLLDENMELDLGNGLADKIAEYDDPWTESQLLLLCQQIGERHAYLRMDFHPMHVELNGGFFLKHSDGELDLTRHFEQRGNRLHYHNSVRKDGSKEYVKDIIKTAWVHYGIVQDALDG